MFIYIYIYIYFPVPIYIYIYSGPPGLAAAQRLTAATARKPARIAHLSLSLSLSLYIYILHMYIYMCVYIYICIHMLRAVWRRHSFCAPDPPYTPAGARREPV